MIADVGGVVTRAAKSRNAWYIQIVIKTRDARDVDLGGVEHFFAARDRLAGFRIRACVPQAFPIFVEVEDSWVEISRARENKLDWIVYAEEELGECRRERDRTARSLKGMEIASRVVELLRGEKARLESDDLLDLIRSPGLGSRPSNMMVDKNPRLVEGSGRR